MLVNNSGQQRLLTLSWAVGLMIATRSYCLLSNAIRASKRPWGVKKCHSEAGFYSASPQIDKPEPHLDGSVPFVLWWGVVNRRASWRWSGYDGLVHSLWHCDHSVFGFFQTCTFLCASLLPPTHLHTHHSRENVHCLLIKCVCWLSFCGPPCVWFHQGLGLRSKKHPLWATCVWVKALLDPWTQHKIKVLIRRVSARWRQNAAF